MNKPAIRRRSEGGEQQEEERGEIDGSGTAMRVPKNVGRYPPKIHGHFKVTDTSNASQSTHHVNEKRTKCSYSSSAIFWRTRCASTRPHMPSSRRSGNTVKLPHCWWNVGKCLRSPLHWMCMGLARSVGRKLRNLWLCACRRSHGIHNWLAVLVRGLAGAGRWSFLVSFKFRGQKEQEISSS